MWKQLQQVLFCFDTVGHCCNLHPGWVTCMVVSASRSVAQDRTGGLAQFVGKTQDYVIEITLNQAEAHQHSTSLVQGIPSGRNSDGVLQTLRFVEAIAIRFLMLLGWRPSLLGWRPSPLGWRLSLLGWWPSLLGWSALDFEVCARVPKQGTLKDLLEAWHSELRNRIMVE